MITPVVETRLAPCDQLNDGVGGKDEVQSGPRPVGIREESRCALRKSGKECVLCEELQCVDLFVLLADDID